MFLVLSVVFLIILYFYGTRNHDYWKKKGVKYEEPIAFFGSNLKQFTKKMNLSDRYAELYKSYPEEKYVGFFRGNMPALLLRDPDLIKHLLCTDFLCFHNRGINPSTESSEPLFKGLFLVEGDTWKLIKQKLTPAFSIAKLKAMFPMIAEQAQKIEKFLDNVTKSSTEIDANKLIAGYTINFVAACGFGINLNSYEVVSAFRKLGKRVVTRTFRDTIVLLLKWSEPEIFKRLHTFAPEVERQTMAIFKHNILQRNYEPSGRNDFIDYMLELRQHKKIVGQSIDKYNADSSPAQVEIELDDKLLMSQVFVFFIAGFETTSTASSFLLNQLAFHLKEQIRCQKEIDNVLARYGGKLCFEAVREMKYLEMCLKESMRILPSPGYILRRSTREYTFPDTNLRIDKGIHIIIPLQGIHLDERYFENPEAFIPERFDRENVQNMNKFAYLPFGDGPRACIGERMGMMVSLAGVAAILSKFDIRPSHKSHKNPPIDPKSTIVQNVTDGLFLTLKRRQ